MSTPGTVDNVLHMVFKIYDTLIKRLAVTIKEQSGIHRVKYNLYKWGQYS